MKFVRPLGAALLGLALTTGVLASPSTAAQAAPPHLTGKKLTVKGNFPDPGLLITSISGTSSTYLYSTGKGFPVRQVTANGGSEAAGNSLEALPAWMSNSKNAKYWAPHVFEVPTNPADSRYVMYFAGSSKDNPKMACLGAAVSAEPTKPFTPRGEALLCGNKKTTVIDPAHFQDAGKNYLVYKKRTFKKDGSSSYQIRAINVDSAWTTTAGKSWKLLDGHGRNVEAPSLVTRKNRVFMFVSVNNYKTCAYRTAYTSSTSIRKPFSQPKILNLGGGANKRYCGPGGADVVKNAAGKYVIAFHGWKGAKDQKHGGIRQTWTGKLRW